MAAFAILTVVALTVSRAQLQSPSVWPMFQHDLAHTGLSQFDTSGNPGLLKWSFETTPFGAPVYGSPAIAADGTVYIGSGVDTNLSVSFLYALNPSKTATCSGGANVNCPLALKWKFEIPGSGSTVESSPAIASDGTIYVGSDNKNLYAVNPNGTEKWVFGTSNEVTSSPAIGADGTIYVGSDDNNLYAVNPNGTQKWAFPTGSSVLGSPVIGPDGTIYVGSDDLNLYALTDGGQNTVTKKWTFATSGRPSPAIGPDGTIYVLDGVSNLFALKPADGSAKWEFSSSNFEIPGSPAIGADGTIYFGGDNALVYAVTDNGSSATEKWAAESGDTIFPSPAIGADGTVYIGQASGYLVAILAPPTTDVVPASLVMGNSPVGDTVTKNLTIKNTGHTNSLYFGSVTSNGSEFVITGNTCPSGGLAPATSCSITIAFTPSSLGPHTATLTVHDSLATSPQHVALSGTGTVDMTVAPTSYGFGSVKDGSKAIKVIVVHNYQTNPVSLGESFSGPNAGDFKVTGGTCTSTLAKTSVCTLIVTYDPSAIGTESATMTVTDNPDPLGPYMVSFSALATIPESVSPTSLHFGNVYQSAAKALSVTVTNHATSGPITLTGTTIGGANAGDFVVTGGGTCGGTLAASSSCTYAVTFTPSTETAEAGTLSIGVTQDPNGGPAVIALSGTGLTPLRVVPASIAFGTVANGHSSVNRTVTVYNYGGAGVSLSESIGGTNMADFAVTGETCGSTLAGGGTSCTYTLKFTPSIVGSESATLGVSAVGDAASPHNVGLGGTGS